MLLAAEDAQQGPSMLWVVIVPALVIMLLWQFIIAKPQRRDQARREAQLKALKPKDRVVTIGGIIGVVTNVHREAGEVTIRVDEGNETPIHFQLGAIAQVLSDQTEGDAAKKDSSK